MKSQKDKDSKLNKVRSAIGVSVLSEDIHVRRSFTHAVVAVDDFIV